MSAPTPDLLGLPRETRLQIIRDVIASVDRAPAFEEVIEDRVAYVSAFETSDIYVPRAEATPICHGSGLLLTSKQLNDETKYALQAMRENEMKGFEFVLDVMYVRGLGLLPTWLSMPVDARAIGTLRVQFRIVQPPARLINPAWIERAQCASASQANDRVDKWLAHVLLCYAFRRVDLVPSYNLVDEHHFVTALGDGAYTVDRLLIDVQPLQVVSDGGETAADGMAPRAADGAPGATFPFGCASHLETVAAPTPEQIGLLFAYKNTALYASLDLGEWLKGILELHVDKDSQSPDVLFNRKMLTDNVGVISIRAIDSRYTELKDLADKIEKLKPACDMT